MRNNSLVFPVISVYVAKSIVRRSCRVKMSASSVTVPLQIMCQLLTAGLVAQNMTVPLMPTRTVGESVSGQVYENKTPPPIWTSPLPETPNSQGCRCGYVAFPELGVAYKRSTNKLNHMTASKSCLAEGAQLAVIDSRVKIDKIINHFAENPGWVGLGMGGMHSFYGTSERMVIDGEFTNDWNSGQATAANCPFLSKSTSGILNFGCGHTFNYVCEIALPRN